MCLEPEREFRLHSGFVFAPGNHKVGTINFYFLFKTLLRGLPHAVRVEQCKGLRPWLALGLMKHLLDSEDLVCLVECQLTLRLQLSKREHSEGAMCPQALSSAYGGSHAGTMGSGQLPGGIWGGWQLTLIVN